jgi:CTP synthase
MHDQKNVQDKGGTMRLGSYPCHLVTNTKAYEAYQRVGDLSSSSAGELLINERHRHRYEFNNKYKNMLEAAGLKVSGLSPDASLVEIVEIVDHPFMLACQFHPEFKSRPDRPHPLFLALVEAATKIKSETAIEFKKDLIS